MCPCGDPEDYAACPDADGRPLCADPAYVQEHTIKTIQLETFGLNLRNVTMSPAIKEATENLVATILREKYHMIPDPVVEHNWFRNAIMSRVVYPGGVVQYVG